MATEDEEPLDVALGYNVTATAFDILRLLARGLEDRGLRASRGAILDRLIKSASLDALTPCFPSRKRNQKR